VPKIDAGHPVSEPSGLARLALLPLARMSALGIPYAQLMRAAGLDERQLRNPDARIPLAAVARLWKAITAQATEPTIGLRLGAGCRVRDLGLVGCVMAYSTTVSAASSVSPATDGSSPTRWW